MSGDKAAGGWTPWPVVDGQLELDLPEGVVPVEIRWPEGPDWPEVEP